jgi:hypothetical protein
VVNVVTHWAELPDRATPEQPEIVDVPSLNATVPPLGEGLPVTVAISVTELPVPEVKDGFVPELSAVVVEVWVWFSVKMRLHPLMEISSSMDYSPPSSTRYKLQLPLRSVLPKPSNMPSVAAPNGAAAVP